MPPESSPEVVQPRRTFLRAAAGAVVLSACTKESSLEPHGSADVTPAEDLMQEHGVLERVLLLYHEAARRLEAADGLEMTVIGDAARLVRRFAEDYHEQLEERHVFPRMEAANRQVELVAVLRHQHQRGRELTDEILRWSAEGSDPLGLARVLRSFERMYRPHMAREDTVLFPAFREVVGPTAYRELGEQFEQEEHSRLGERGFAAAVAEIARLEHTLGIGDLAQYTPAPLA